MKITLLSLYLLAGAWPVQAAPVPPAERLNESALQLATRASLAHAVEYFRQQARADTEGWFVPPARTQQVVGWKDVEVRYVLRKVMIPKFEYENYETYERVPGASATDASVMQKVTRRRIKRQIGTEEFEDKFLDPKGNLVETRRHAVYDVGGPDLWLAGRFGHNGLILYALRQAGVPGNDEGLVKVAELMADFCERYGIPDHTWDVAWLTAGLATMPGERYAELTRRMAGKLLDGQITEGKARGLWGPVCIHPAMLATLMVKEDELTKDFQKVKASPADKKGTRRESRLADLESSLQDIQARIRSISLLGSQLQHVETWALIKPGHFPPVKVAGAPHFFYNQTSADMDSTEVALFGLSVAAKNSRLPAESFRLVDQGRPIVPPEKAQAVLARAAAALAENQKPTGGWDELNRHQPVTAFDGFKFLPVPVDPKTFMELESPVTLSSTAGGIGGLLRIGEAVGLETLSGRFGNNIQNGVRARRALLEQYLDDKLGSIPVGGIVPPYDALRQLTGIQRRFNTSVEDGRDLWMRLAYQTLKQRGREGLWGKEVGRYLMFSGQLARIKAMPQKPLGADGTVSTDIQKTAYVSPYYYEKGFMRDATTVQERMLATASAMLFLADGVRPPVAGVYQATEADFSDALWLGVRQLRQKFGVDLTYGRLTGKLAFRDVAGFPLLFVRGTGATPLGEETGAALRGYVASGGLIVVETPALPAGDEFAKMFQEFIGRELPALRLGAWTEEKFLGELAGKVNLQAHAHADGRPAVVYLPVTRAAPSDNTVVASAQAGRLVANLLQFRVDETVLKADFPIAFEKGEDLALIARTAIEGLESIGTRPVDVPAAAPQPAPAVKPAAAAESEMTAPVIHAPPLAPAVDETF